MTTPEGKVKEKINEILERYNVYAFKPVQTGLGADGLDYHCVVTPSRIPIPFFIEAKRLKAEATERQQELKSLLRQTYRCNVFHVDGPSSLRILEAWLAQIHRSAEKSAYNPN